MDSQSRFTMDASVPSDVETCCKTKAWFQFGLFCLLFLVLVFRTNRKLKLLMRCSNENIYKRPKRATKGRNENQMHLPVLVFEIELIRILSQKQERAMKSNRKQRTTNGNTPQKPKRAIKNIFHSHFHSFASALDLWKVVDIKTNENHIEQQRATKSSKIATKSNKKQQKVQKSKGIQAYNETVSEKYRSLPTDALITLKLEKDALYCSVNFCVFKVSPCKNSSSQRFLYYKEIFGANFCSFSRQPIVYPANRRLWACSHDPGTTHCPGATH